MRLRSAAGYLVLLSFFFKHGAFENQNESVKEPQSPAFINCCFVNGSNSTDWILRGQGAKIMSGCLQLNGKESIDRSEECHFFDIGSKNSGYYWCENAAENNTINITVVCKNISENSTADSADEKSYRGSLVWVSGLCIILVLLVLPPLLWLLFPGFREKFCVCPNGAFRRKRVLQEMPKTKQDVTEIQWDLPWMEMDNLLDK